MILLNAHILAVDAARQWHADSGKPRTYILCEKKHEWICSNASTSSKSPLSVQVWQMCLSVKLRLCRLLFMQYKITWLVNTSRQACGNTSLSLRFHSDIWVNTECKAIFAVASFHNLSAQFANSAWCSNSSKFVRCRVNLQVSLIALFV